jgi:hypothetical protein
VKQQPERNGSRRQDPPLATHAEECSGDKPGRQVTYFLNALVAGLRPLPLPSLMDQGSCLKKPVQLVVQRFRFRYSSELFLNDGQQFLTRFGIASPCALKDRGDRGHQETLPEVKFRALARAG